MTRFPARSAALLALTLAAASSAASSAAWAQAPAAAPAPAPAAAPDYRAGANWLCRPGRADACGSADLTATRVTARGELSPVAYAPAAAPAVDCFYVYPTVSHDPTPNSDLTPGPEERGVVQQQFARFGSVCRTYAPLYRQVTLTALQSIMMGQPVAADREIAYADVLAAWRDYLAHDNGGRGFVLIGHSQGSGVLTRLIKEEIDGKPVARRMVSAILAGTSLPVPPGKDVGGAFASTPLCRKAGQTGCVVAFASFRATSPPPANSRFGRIAALPGGPPVMSGMAAACVNPAALGGGRAELHPFMTATGVNITALPQPAPTWVAGQPPLKTAFAVTPGLYSAQCVDAGGFNYLAVTVSPDPTDVRRATAEGTGDVVVGGAILKDWGLHLIDMNLTMGDLTALVAVQSAAYAKGAEPMGHDKGVGKGAKGARKAGMNPARLERIGDFLQRAYVEPGRIPGCQVLVARRGHVAYRRSLGMMDVERARPMAEDAVVRIYSMTKPVVSVALMTLWERGAFQLDEPIAKAFPEFSEPKVWVEGEGDGLRTEPARGPITYRQVLCHTAGFTYGGLLEQVGAPGSGDPVDAEYKRLRIRRDPAEDLDAFMGKLAQAPLKYEPGVKWMYSLATDVAGALVERLSGRRLDAFLREEIFEPLGMGDTAFSVPEGARDRFAACYARDTDKSLKLIDDPENSPFLTPPTFLSGGGGLVSTLEDYGRFCDMLRCGGIHEGERIIGPRTLDLMTANHLPGGGDLSTLALDSFSETLPVGVGFGLGFASTMDGVAAGYACEDEFYWGGAASTAFWVDPHEDLYVVFLTQLMPSTTYNFRAQLRSLVYAAIED